MATLDKDNKKVGPKNPTTHYPGMMMWEAGIMYSDGFDSNTTKP